MPNLGDYLGLLMSEITIARMQADLEAVRVAELYASHPLLRHMTVPHFRLPDVELDVPVVISEMEEPRPGESPRGGVNVDELRKVFDKVLADYLRSEGVSTTREEQEKIRASLDVIHSRFRRPPETAVDVMRLADDLTTAAFATLLDPARPRGPIEPSRIADLKTAVRDSTRIEFLKRRTSPPRLGVLVTTSQIRDAGTIEGLMRIRLKLSEHGVEWTRIESDGKEENRLVPE